MQKIPKATHVVPQRVIMVIMSLLSLCLAYMLRISLAYAITEMVVHPHKNMTLSPDVCPPFENEWVAKPNQTVSGSSSDDDKFTWTQFEQGIVLSSFYIGYILTHIPGGILSAKFGGKKTLFFGTVIATVFSIITPLAIDYGGMILLIVCRIIVGIGEGTMFPACNTLLAAWIPLKERSISATAVYSGGMMGSIFGSALSGILIHHFGWRSVFYFFGVIGVVWAVVFWIVCADNPSDHPFISVREQNYLQSELGQLKRDANLPPTPWKPMLTSLPMIALIFAQVGHNWGLFIIINDLPKYMSEVLRFPIKENGLYLSLIYALMWIVGISTGFLSDFLIKKNLLGVTKSRKMFTSIAAYGPGIFMVFASYAGCDRSLVLVMFLLGIGSMGTFYSGLKANSLDIAPNYAGVIMAVANGLGGFTGVIGPALVGFIAENSLLTEWRTVFWITFVILFISATVFNIFASGDIQPWNQPNSLSRADIVIKNTTQTDNNSKANCV